MKRVLLTGMSGTGKTTLVNALVARGYTAIDADDDQWSELVCTSTRDGVAGECDLLWREDRLATLLADERARVVFVAGCAPNQVKFYPRFDHIVLLSAPAALLAERLGSRTNNPYGKTPAELARTLELKQTIEPKLRAAAELEIDTSVPPERVMAAVLQVVGEA